MTDPLAPYDLSHLCDGRRTDFPLDMLVETVKVMLNGVYLEEGLDYLLAHKHGESRVELRRAPAPGDTLVVLRVPARASAAAPHHAPQVHDDVPPYEHLPKEVKHNIAPEQWPAAQREVVHTGTSIPETTRYINLKNGLIFAYQVGQTATGPLLPLHVLGAARGKEDRAYNHQHRHT